MAEVLIAARGVKKYFPARDKQTLHAVDGVTLDIYEGECLGLVGESGCGKSTLGRCLLGLYALTSGTITYRGAELQNLKEKEMRPYRQKLQMIFQDPYSALNPRMTVRQSIEAPLSSFRIGSREERRTQAEKLAEYVGLRAEQLDKYPHELSGGQRQRVMIARAMILNPDFIVCDEPVSALDASVRAQVLNLMKRIQSERHPAYLFISHDLSVVHFIAHRVAVMYLGKIVEMGPRDAVYMQTAHPYTRALLRAIPQPEVPASRRRELMEGDVPSPLHIPSGCRFRTRCPNATPACAEREPELRNLGGGHFAACHLA